ncbi:unnamed protein product [Caenorhabditis bovis]|uniref:Cytochrome-b5 reductase n=1 Tax=Caenorhabditis bovis TaxID=2654633 RepID=A0A8S1F4K3_9PELO|nr:unnamed protein product [Caenorhabditis bovis]
MNNLAVKNGLFPKSLSANAGRSEIGRVKVALAPGKGFLDWLKLTTGKVLAKRQHPVDHIELAKHDKINDCWVLLFGDVYDVTQYLDFHPGGVPELMRAAGRDATSLFNETHAWVNYQSMLKACRVGQFIGDASKLPACLPPTNLKDPNLLGPSSSFSTIFKDNTSELFGTKIIPTENGLKIKNDEWQDLRLENVVVSLESRKIQTAITTSGDELSSEIQVLRILVKHFWKAGMEFEFESSNLLKNQNFEVDAFKSQVEVKFLNVTFEQDFREIFDENKVKVTRSPGVSYHKCEVNAINRLNHNTLVYSLRIPNNIHYGIAMGHHVSVKVRKGNSVLYRPYTPIRAHCGHNDPKRIDLMIKIYPDGVCTPSLEKLKPGDCLEISDPIGNKKFEDWVKYADELYLIAGGTGITPMVDILDLRKEWRGKNYTCALIFNKTQDDTPTGEQAQEFGWILSEWAKNFDGDEQFQILNILSETPLKESESYHTGRVSSELIRNVARIPDCTNSRRKAFICGPDGFMIEAKRALENLGLTADDIHIFQG